MPRYSNMSFSVAPRYTAGSPCALVREEIARGVARDEQRAYEQALTGAYGAQDLDTAKTKGLKGIAEVCFERGNGWDVRDLITGEQFRRECRRPEKIKSGMLVVRAGDGTRIQPGNRVALLLPDGYNVLVFFGSREDEAALARRDKAPYELPHIQVSKYDELTVEMPLPEGRKLDY